MIIINLAHEGIVCRNFLHFTACCNRLRESFRATKLQKRYKKALGKTRKSGAEGVNMKLVSEYIPILICFVRFLSLYPDGS